VTAIAAKIGCTAQSLNEWSRKLTSTTVCAAAFQLKLPNG
jgi:hypothetical protein